MAFQDYRKVVARMQQISEKYAEIAGAYKAILASLSERPPSITDELDKIPGRRIFYNLSGELQFTLNDDQRRGQPISMLVSQDGMFVATHYPTVLWRPTAPANTLNFGLWRPVQTAYLADQATPASGNFDLDEDVVSISYDVVDGGSQRNFQNLPAVPGLSTPLNLIPLPVPTPFSPNTTVQFFPTFNSIRFSSAPNTITTGILSVTLSGYRIVNL